MSAYRPYHHSNNPGTWQYLHGGAVRFFAGVLMSAMSGVPTAVVFYCLFVCVRLLHEKLPWYVLPFFTIYCLVKAIVQSVFTFGLSTSKGCIPDNGKGPSKTVAVVGGGISGLITAKELLEEGHVPIVFEASDSIGGVWVVNGSLGRGRVWENTVSSSSALNTAISDFPIETFFPSARDQYHMHQSEVADYIRRYAAEHSLMNYVRLHSRVVRVSRRGDGKKWSVVARSNLDGTETAEIFDAVAICTGQVETPRRPRLKGEDNFIGRIVHVADVSNEDEFRGQKVVCIGNGETASDVVEMVSSVASHVYLSIRNPFVCLPRNFFGVPPDFFETRSLYVCPSWIRWLILKPQLLSTFLLRFWDARDKTNGTRRISPSWTHFITLLLNRKYFLETLTMRRTLCSSLLVTKTERMLYSVDAGDCTIKPEVVSLGKRDAIFEDSSSASCDVVLLMTGYQEHFPMFEDKNLQKSSSRKRYLLTFAPEIGSSLAFIGFCRGHAGALLMPSEMQARWFSLLLSEKRSLPSCEEMCNEVSESFRRNNGYAVTLGGWFLTNFIAKNHVGCSPNFLRIFWRHGFSTTWHVYTQSFASYMFRFEGPHAKPGLAASMYKTSATCGKPVAWYMNEVMCIAIGCFFFCVRQIPVIGRLRAVEMLMNQWY